MPADPFAAYLAAVQAALQSGQATEHTYRPALKTLIEAQAAGLTATNEPKRAACGAPDYVVSRPTAHGPLTVGYIEAKDLGKLTTDIERGDQMRRYLAALPNLILTDYLEFRWYTDGKRRSTARLATLGAGGKLLPDKGGAAAVGALLADFQAHQPAPVSKPAELAQRMARLTHLIRDIIITAFSEEQASPLLKGWRAAFAQVLIADLDQPGVEKTAEFADMFAQTLAYGLFSARIMDRSPATFTRQEAQELIPPTNPFLREFFYQISGPKLRDEPYGGLVDDLAALLAQTDMDAVLADFGKRTRQQDPVVHFYETFLAAYDPKLREARGVYYTPEPVVSYIVRSVDALLRSRFARPGGLADPVLVLDPACGTGTFLYAIVDQIRAGFMAGGNAGLWSGYVREQLLPRLFGFELLMAPYAVAHFKLGLQLAGRDLPPAARAAWAFDFAGDERVGIYLTNTLEGPHDYGNLPLFTEFLAKEVQAANEVKSEREIMVVVGNPPYSGHSANKGAWISKLLRDYYQVDGRPLGERNPKWLQDDYVKFIRFGQWRIDRSGTGILAFISNNGYLDNPTFRGMRQSLMQSFTDIYVLDLHGNSKKRETALDGSPDENVFDIQQGVAIALFVKAAGHTGPARVHHAELWGVRESKDGEGGKYPWLFGHDLTDTDWQDLAPQSPHYLFVPQEIDLLAEYEQGWKITDVMPVNSVGIVTGQDEKTITLNPNDAEKLAQSYHLDRTVVKPILYRIFDKRYIVYDKQVVTRSRSEVMHHMLVGNNLGLAVGRAGQVIGPGEWNIVFCTRAITEFNLYRRGGNNLFPLYIYPTQDKATLFDAQEETAAPGGRRANLNPAFISALAARIGRTWLPDGRGDGVATFGPEDVFDYIYAVFHAPGYRHRYAAFLKIDFPRLPLPADGTQFQTLVAMGTQLVGLHLLETAAPPVTSYPVAGDNRVATVRYVPPTAEVAGQVWINATQYFAGIAPEVWAFAVGGYTPAEKWLKDRKGRVLTYADLTHYGKLIAALTATIPLLAALDAALPIWPPA